MAEHLLMLGTVVHPHFGVFPEGHTYEIEEGSAKVAELSVWFRLKGGGAVLALPKAECLIYQEGVNAWRRGVPGSPS